MNRFDSVWVAVVWHNVAEVLQVAVMVAFVTGLAVGISICDLAMNWFDFGSGSGSGGTMLQRF